METATNSDRLKRKFSKLEMDFEDEGIDFKITTESLKKIQTNAEIARERTLAHTLWRGAKLGCKSAWDLTSTICRILFVGGYRLSKKTTQQFMKTAREKEEKLEILLDKTITSVELAKKEHSELVATKEQTRNRILQIYKTEVDEVFKNNLSELTLDYGAHENENIVKAQVHQLEVFQMMSKMLVKSNMMLNLKNIVIHATLDEKMNLSTSLVCEMHTRGHLWAIMFGKTIVPEINNMIETRQGSVQIRQVSNLSRIEDHFQMNMQFNIAHEKTIIPSIPSIVSDRQDF